MDWQPIETHDKSATAVLVWVPVNKCIYCADWFNGEYQIFGSLRLVEEQAGRITHWMPLPPPPADRSEP